MQEYFVTERFSIDIKKLKIRHSEIARYMYAKNSLEELDSLISECLFECENCFDLQGVYMKLPVIAKENVLDFSAFSVKSNGLAKLLKESNEAVLFGATIGYGIDRLIKRYSVISPVKALTFNAVGTEVLECFCDELCDFVKEKMNTDITPRFSPGYGDLSIETQKDISRVLGLSKNIGITLTQNLAMTPSKSVTAIFGTICGEYGRKNKCSECDMLECEFKKNK